MFSDHELRGLTMRAVVVDKSVSGGLALREIASPVPKPSEVLVRVHAISLNRGEVRMALGQMPDGWRPGWDFAGIVEKATDGSGPLEGMAVSGMAPSGAWAELVCVPATQVAALPRNVSFSQAATLPVAGLTALHALRRGGALAGQHILITGANGGVGTFACQLARQAGAHVTAVIRERNHETLMRDLGAESTALSAEIASLKERFSLILESVGGSSLAAALGLLAPGGTCVLFGASQSSETVFDASKFRVGGTSLYGLILGYELQREPPSIGLPPLLEAMAAGPLKAMISVERPWLDIGTVAADLMARRFSGKAVLTL
jgi:NADPH:quinone reductase